MISGFTPTWMIRATYDISPETLLQLGIKVVLTDLDNTLIAWNNPMAPLNLRIGCWTSNGWGFNLLWSQTTRIGGLRRPLHR